MPALMLPIPTSDAAPSGSPPCRASDEIRDADPSQEASRPWQDRWLVAGLGAGAFGIYLLGACPTIYVGDSGELVAAAATLGIPHPSGYPLYVLLGHAWISLLPWGSVAWKMSIFSAVFASAAVSLLHLCCRELRLDRSAAAFAAASFAVVPSFWSQANVQRVYSLSACLLLLVTLLAFRWWRTREARWMAWAAFFCGLGATNHTFLAAYGLSVAVFAFLVEPGLLRRPLDLVRWTAAGLGGLLPYAYMPIRSRQDPRLDWGNPETLESLLAAVTRQGFWNRRWMSSAADWIPILGDYVHSLWREGLGAGLVLALVGLLSARRQYPVLLLLLGMAANLSTQGLHGSRSDIFIWHRYYIPSYAFLLLLAAIGAQVLLDRARQRPRSASPFGRKSVVAYLLLLPVALLLTGWAANDRSRFRLADDFSRRLLATLPPGAPLAASDDNVLFVLLYLQLVEGVRPDVHLILQGIGDAELPALRFDPDESPVFFTHHPNWHHPAIEIEPWGLVFKTVRRGAPPSPLPELPSSLLGENDRRVPKDYLASNLLGHFHTLLGMTYEKRDWPRAHRELLLAAAKARDNDVLFYNLGLIYERNGMPRRALEAFEQSVRINPRRLAADKPARASDRVVGLRPQVAHLERLEEELSGHPSLARLGPGSEAWLRGQAALLSQRGETDLARGRQLLAEELAAAEQQARPGKASRPEEGENLEEDRAGVFSPKTPEP